MDNVAIFLCHQRKKRVEKSGQNETLPRVEAMEIPSSESWTHSSRILYNKARLRTSRRAYRHTPQLKIFSASPMLLLEYGSMSEALFPAHRARLFRRHLWQCNEQGCCCPYLSPPIDRSRVPLDRNTISFTHLPPTSPLNFHIFRVRLIEIGGTDFPALCNHFSAETIDYVSRGSLWSNTDLLCCSR